VNYLDSNPGLLLVKVRRLGGVVVLSTSEAKGSAAL